jgi:hypothetical protein
LAYLLISKLSLLIFPPLTMVLTALRVRSLNKDPHLDENLVPMQLSKVFKIYLSSFKSILIAIYSFKIFDASSKALKYELTITDG